VADWSRVIVGHEAHAVPGGPFQMVSAKWTQKWFSVDGGKGRGEVGYRSRQRRVRSKTGSIDITPRTRTCGRLSYLMGKIGNLSAVQTRDKSTHERPRLEGKQCRCIPSQWGHRTTFIPSRQSLSSSPAKTSPCDPSGPFLHSPACGTETPHFGILLLGRGRSQSSRTHLCSGELSIGYGNPKRRKRT